MVGWLAAILTEGRGLLRCLGSVVVGAIGAFLGGWIMALLGGDGLAAFSWRRLLVALLGAVVLLAISRLFTRRRS